MRIIAFDLDETLGNFSNLSAIWNDANNQMSNLDQNTFNYYCELFPEFFRPYMLDILNYLVINKQLNDKIVIYTNNNGERSWTLHIKNYIESKLKKKVFDDVICAYKINGRIIEPNRSSYNKIYSDLLRCIDAPYGTKVCFVDDRIHEDMINPFVSYIHIKPYHTKFNKKEIMMILSHSGLPYYDYKETSNMLNTCRNYYKSQSEEIVDNKVTEEMFSHLSKFVLRKDEF